ncbi:ABC-type transport auxiliary lipoprotein family protein [Sphingomonas sp. HF-S3]|uniref:ABC-type transport auxiliary lipoprotein family protein n=1 Tax=Sphingomonas rustica TaxID=3103142 RepID=A0ABV0B2U9_9SPHN
MTMSARQFALPLMLSLALPLGGCISIGGGKPPASLMSLESSESLAVGQVQNSGKSSTITIGVPMVPQALATNRVPVTSGGTAIAYVKDAAWVEGPSRLFARLLADTVTARTGRVVLSSRQSQADPGAQLTGELRMFGIDEPTGDAVVVYDAVLSRQDGGVFEKQRFEARVPVGTVDATTVGPALNSAANQVASKVADWVGR